MPEIRNPSATTKTRVAYGFCGRKATLNIRRSPGEIKRREVSWTLTKKLDAFAGPGEIKRREVSWTLTKKLDAFAGPGEIKRREVVLEWTLKLAQKRSRVGRWSWASELGLLLRRQLFPNSGATDIVLVTAPHSS